MNTNENDMDSNNTSSRIPKLRFPGFTGEWEELPLSHFLFEHKTKSDGKCEVHSVSVTKGVVNQAAYLGRSYAAADTSKYNLAKPNDIIYTKSPTGAFPYGIVKQNKNPYNVIVSPLYAVYTPINKYIGYILDSYFESPVNTNNYLSSLVQKGAKNTIQITNETFISKSVCFPTDPAEQQKIASCLSELDNLIAAQGQKVDTLKEKKKGLMQQLFPQEGETSPRFRFPGHTGDWHVEELGNVAERVSVGLATSVTPYYRSKGVVMFRNLNIKADELDDRDILYLDEAFAEANPSKKIHAGDVLTVHTGYVGISCIVPEKYDGALTFTTLVTTTKKNVLSPRFLCCYLNSDAGAKEIVKLQAGGGRNNLNVNDFIRLHVPLPPSITEQTKIAECLTALNNVISSESAKLDALKDHKKGLMQQLFPQPEK